MRFVDRGLVAVSVGSYASVLQNVRCSNCRQLRNDFLPYGFGSGMRRGQGREIIQSHDLPLASSVWRIFSSLRKCEIDLKGAKDRHCKCETCCPV